MKVTPRCSCVVKDGSQCSQRVTDGSNPPICHIHRAQQQGQGLGIVAQQHTDDVQVLLRRLTKDRDPAIRLRAIEAILKWEERDEQGCDRCAARVPRDQELERIVTHATPAQRAEMQVHLDAIKAIKTDILVYIAQGGTPPVEPERPDVPFRTVARIPVDAKPTTSPREPDPEPPYALPHQHWREVGLFRLDNGEVTHALGDAHAQQILSGAISLDDAKAAHTEALRRATTMPQGEF